MVRHGYRVVCPDVAGRGDSDWLENPMEYSVPTYVYDMVTLIARLDVESVHWVGTSLGGLIGMSIAAMQSSPITRLVLNDVGPVLTAVSLERLSSYVGKWPPLPTIEAAELFVRSTSASFGPHTEAEWRFLTEHVVRKNADGSLRMHYDPAIAVPFNAELSRKDVALWSFYDTIRCPTLVLRGEQSDLLRRDTAEQMAVRGPRAKSSKSPGSATLRPCFTTTRSRSCGSFCWNKQSGRIDFAIICSPKGGSDVDDPPLLQSHGASFSRAHSRGHVGGRIGCGRQREDRSLES